MFFLCFPRTALFLQRVQFCSSVNIVRTLDRPCSKFELRSRDLLYLRRMQRFDPAHTHTHTRARARIHIRTVFSVSGRRTEENRKRIERRRKENGNRDKGGEQARSCCLDWCKRASRVANASRTTQRLPVTRYFPVWPPFILVVWSTERSTGRVKQTRVPFHRNERSSIKYLQTLSNISNH